VRLCAGHNYRNGSINDPMDPLVSVVTTVYKRTEYLPQALSSIQAQTFGDFEVIIADDSGSANSQSIFAGYASDPRFIYQPNPQTLGVTPSLSRAFQRARGKYISILNDDDLWKPEFLQALVSPLQAREDRVLAFSDHWIIDETGRIDEQATTANTARYGRELLPEGEVPNLPWFVLETNGVPLAMASVFRRNALDPAVLVKEVSGSYDVWVSSILAASGKSFYYVPRRLTLYRVHRAMETARRTPNKSMDQVFIFKSIREQKLFPAMDGYLRGRHSGALFRVGRDHLLFDQRREARDFFRQAWQIHKEPKAILACALSYFPLSVRKKLKLTF